MKKGLPIVFGIATDIIKKDDITILSKEGKRQFGAVGWYRIFNPLTKLGAECVVGYGTKASAEGAMAMRKKGDIWFTKIADNEGIDHIYASHRDFTGAKLIVDLDDDPSHINEDHPDYQALAVREDMRIRMVKIADHLVVATQEIADAVKHLNPRITVIPNAIDPKIWEVKKRKKNKNRNIRIGWIASGSHIADMPIIKPVMEIILKKYPNVEFHFAGITWNEMKGNRVFHHVGRGAEGYLVFPEWYANLGIDIAIAPLKDTQFNRCKSNIKWLEASMLELPMVASDVTPYRSIRHATTGFLASNTEQWVKYLSFLIENAQKRRQIGKNAKTEVLKNWTIDKQLPKYEELFQKITEKKDITVVTAITGGKDTLKKQNEYKGVEYVAFSDEDIKDSQWKVRKACNKFVRPVMNAKIHKILTHKYIDTPYIVWMDGNQTLKQDPHELIKIMGDKDYAFFKHPTRKGVYEEADACYSYGKGNIEEIGEQIKEYAKMNFPEKTGLCEMTAFVRKNNPRANAAFERWWVEVSRFSNRDQIAFPVAFKGEKWATIPGKVADQEGDRVFSANDYFTYEPHQHYNENPDIHH